MQHTNTKLKQLTYVVSVFVAGQEQQVPSLHYLHGTVLVSFLHVQSPEVNHGPYLHLMVFLDL